MRRAITVILCVGTATLAQDSSQRPISLSVTPASNSLIVEAALAGKRWASPDVRHGRASFTVALADMKAQPSTEEMPCGLSTGLVEYDIEKSTLTASIPCSPLPAVPYIVSLAGVKDIGGQAFELKSATVIPQNPAPLKPPAISAPAASTQTQPEKHNAGFGPKSKYDWLTLVNTSLVVGLGLIWTFFGILLRRRPDHRLPEPVRALAPVRDPEIIRLKSELAQALKGAESALEKASDARRLAEAVPEMSLRVASVEALARDRNRPDAVIAGLERRLGALETALELPKETSAPAAAGPVLGVDFEEAATLAVVNRWLAERDGNPENLGKLASELGLTYFLATHRDLNQSFQTVSTFEYGFEHSTSGPWFWTQIPQSADVWAIPTDAALLRGGFAPNLLARLFAGMENAPQEFEFRRFMKPCRLHPVGSSANRYCVVSRGIVQLENSPVPDVPTPQTFEQLLRVRNLRLADMPTQGALSAGWLADWKKQTSSQLTSQSAQLAVMQDELDDLKAWFAEKAGAPVHSSGENTLQIVTLRNELITRTEALKDRQQTLERQLAEIAKQLAHAVSPPKPPLEPIAAAPAVEATAPLIPDPMLLGPAHSPGEVAPSPAESPAHEASPAPPEGLVRLPSGWREAFLRAARKRGSDPGITDVPSPETYVRRLHNLAHELQALDPGLDVAVVHLNKNPKSETFQVHNTRMTSDGETWCLVCDGVHTWQLCVSIGQSGRSGLLVLFPLGMLGKANYSSGYTMPIDDLPSSSFSTQGIAEPALLRPTDGITDAYTVSRKMRYAAPGSEKGRPV